MQRRYLDAVLTLLQQQLDGVLLEHHRQYLADRVHQLAEARALITVLVTAIQARALALAGEGRQLAEQAKQIPVDLLRMHLLHAQVVAQHRFVTVDQLQHHEVADLGATHLPVALIRSARVSPRWASMLITSFRQDSR